MVVGFSSLAMATSDDDWYCKDSKWLKGAELQCVSCGIQTYFRNKHGKEVIPSEKWLLLLGLTARQTIGLGKSTDAVDNKRIRVIAQIQRYGFCTKYGEDRKEKSGEKTWKTFAVGYNNQKYNDDTLSDIAKVFGFNKPFFGGSVAKENLRYLLNNRPKDKDDYKSGETVPDDFSKQSWEDKRSQFMTRLSEAVENKKNIISSEPEGDDLRTCLEQIKQEQDGNVNNPVYKDFLENKEQNLDFCKAMTESCELEDTISVCGGFPKPNQSEKPAPPPPPPSTDKIEVRAIK